jgi:hypothetical protein
MTPHERLRISIAVARYLEALERDDDATLTALWQSAITEPGLLDAFRDLHSGLIEEDKHHTRSGETASVAAAVEEHLTSGEIVRALTGDVTVAEVADELFRHAPDRLPAEAHLLNEKLRRLNEPLPSELGLPNLLAWAVARFGPTPDSYWKAFRMAAMKLRIRVNSDTEFQLAARQTKLKPEGK